MMKVLYLLHSTEMHGATISFLTMIRGLLEKEVKPYILIPNHSETFERLLSELNVDYQVIPIASSFFPLPPKGKIERVVYYLKYFRPLLRLILCKCKSLWSIIRVVKRINPDIIHTNVGIIHEGFWCSKLLSIPHVWHLREFQDKDFNWAIFPSKKIFKKELFQSNVITISHAIYLHFGLLNNAQTIYNGILSRKESCLAFPKKKYFLCASRVHPSKGHRDVITAFSSFRKENEDFFLYILGDGDGKYIRELQTYAKSLNCDKNIKWLGFQKDVKKFMKEAVALIVASKYEGFGRMTAEASFYGSLVIGRNTGGTLEILNNTGGELFSDTKELCYKMKIIANMTEEDYRERALKAQNKAQEFYSIESNVEKVFCLYESLCLKK